MWIQVDQVRARDSRWFGVRGLLKVVVWLLLIVGAYNLYRSAAPLLEFATKGLPDGWFFIVMTLLLVAKLVLSGWLIHAGLNGLAGVRSFPRDATRVLIGMMAVAIASAAAFAVAFADFFQEALPDLLPELLLTVAGLGGLLAYLQTSRQVNATYRCRLRDNEVAAAAS